MGMRKIMLLRWIKTNDVRYIVGQLILILCCVRINSIVS